MAKKAEQLAKEKHIKLKRDYDKLHGDYTKYKEEAEMRLENLRNENSILSSQLQKALADTAEVNERNSQSSSGQHQSGQDVLKIVEDYGRQLETKT